MRTLIFLLRKEFLQIFRNKLILRIIFIMPVLQLIILPFAANYEMKNILLSIIDHDHSEYSRKLINKFISSGYFKLTNVSSSYAEAIKTIEDDKSHKETDDPESRINSTIKETSTDHTDDNRE